MKAQIQAGAQPWAGEYQKLLSAAASFGPPQGMPFLYSLDDGESNAQRNDAFAAYSLALLWYFSGNDAYGKLAIAILNSWSVLQAFDAGTDQDKLQAGWTGAVFAPAAEIMRLYSGWSAAQIASFQAMFRRAYYPQLNTMSTWNGNVDLTQIDALMAIAVFNDDLYEFNIGLARLANRLPAYFYLTSDGPLPPSIAGDKGNTPQFWYYPARYVNGLTQETCRDNGHHTQFSLGSAIHAMETAWHQGVDVYSLYQTRMTAAWELQARFFNTGSMQGVCGNSSSQMTASPDRYDTWEVYYNHYHNRRGLSLPNTQQVIVNQIRPNAIRSRLGWNLVYETLTHANLPSNT